MRDTTTNIRGRLTAEEMAVRSIYCCHVCGTQFTFGQLTEGPRVPEHKHEGRRCTGTGGTLVRSRP